MTLLLIGLVLFFAPHLIPMAPARRARMLERLGENRYKIGFSLVTGLGFVLIVWGYMRAPAEPFLYAPWPSARAVAPLALTVAFIFLAAAHTRSHLRAWFKHPMLIGVAIWALVHLLANGELRAVWLFGAFLLYALVDLVSAIQRRAHKTFAPSIAQDALAVAAGLGAALLVMLLHRHLFGVPVVAWGW